MILFCSIIFQCSVLFSKLFASNIFLSVLKITFFPPLAYGKVFLVRKLRGNDRGKLYAMKVLKKASIVQKQKTLEHAKTERQVLEAIRQSPFLVTLHYAFQTDSKLHLILGKLLIFILWNKAFYITLKDKTSWIIHLGSFLNRFILVNPKK